MPRNYDLHVEYCLVLIIRLIGEFRALMLILCEQFFAIYHFQISVFLVGAIDLHVRE